MKYKTSKVSTRAACDPHCPRYASDAIAERDRRIHDLKEKNAELTQEIAGYMDEQPDKLVPLLNPQYLTEGCDPKLAHKAKCR